MEQRERDDESSAVQKHAGGSGDGKGKHRPKKLPMADTKPSLMGRRVEPVIDAALRAKVEAAAAKKQKAKVFDCDLTNGFNPLKPTVAVWVQL